MRYLISIVAVIRCAVATTNTVAVILNVREGANVTLSADHPGTPFDIPFKWYLSIIHGTNETTIRNNTGKIMFDNTTKMVTILNFTRDDIGGYGFTCIYNGLYYNQMYHVKLKEKGGGGAHAMPPLIGKKKGERACARVFIFNLSTLDLSFSFLPFI